MRQTDVPSESSDAVQDTELKYTQEGAEVCGEHLEKGRGVRVVGRLKQDRWTSPEGQTRSKVSIVAEHVEFKPQPKGKDGDGKDDGAAEADGKAADEQVQEEAGLREASGL